MGHTMPDTPTSNQRRLDRFGIWLSALCAVHCLLGVLLIAGLGLGVGMGGALLFSPAIHRFGLALAMLVAGVGIGIGAVRHRRPLPFVIAMMGLSFMGGALAVDHGIEEAVLTTIGVALVAVGHFINLRMAH